MALKIENDRVVGLAYRITDSEGRLFDEKTPGDQYQYLHGRGQIVGPVERALVGKTAGYRAEISLAPRDAYGEYLPQLVCELSRENFPPELTIEVGMKFDTSNQLGETMTVRIIEIDDDQVTVDGNHPLAGLDLIFEVRVLEVREATAGEIESGGIGRGAQSGKTPFGSSGGSSGPPSGALH